MKCPLVEFNNPILPSQRRGNIFKQLEIDRTVLEADVIINLPKFKTHSLTLLTLGVKNLFGCIPGPRKALWHLKAGEDRKTFAQILVDVYRVIQPSLTILDGIVGMEGNGPNSGRPISLGLILASSDSLSLDQITCDLLGISRKSLLTNRVAIEQGLGKDGIEVVGERVEDVKIGHFQFPTLSQPDWNLPGFLRKALKNALTSKPVVREEICSTCNRCAEICPPKALARKEKDLVFDYGRCIRCLCCLEVCPEGAISIRQGWALRIVSRRQKAESS
jgi:ferredoxin